MTKATKVHKAFISAWTKILVHLPLRFRLWWMHRSNERQLRLLDNRYGPLLEAARKAKDDENKESVHAEYTRERVLILMPTYMAVDAMLEREARKRGIRVPEKNEGKGDWIRELVTDNWMLTAEAERVLRNEIREEQRAHNDEMRKWATLFFILVGTIFAFLSYRTKQTQPDPCPVNYYRNDSGACVFALLATPPQPTLPASRPPGKIRRTKTAN